MSEQGLTNAALQPADILLVRGTSDLSKGIMQADGGNYSHAALWSGDHVVESTLPLVRAVTLAESIAGVELVDAYRYRSQIEQPLSIVSKALQYVGRPYAALSSASTSRLAQAIPLNVLVEQRRWSRHHHGSR